VLTALTPNGFDAVLRGGVWDILIYKLRFGHGMGYGCQPC